MGVVHNRILLYNRQCPSHPVNHNSVSCAGADVWLVQRWMCKGSMKNKKLKWHCFFFFLTRMYFARCFGRVWRIYTHLIFCNVQIALYDHLELKNRMLFCSEYNSPDPMLQWTLSDDTPVHFRNSSVVSLRGLVNYPRSILCISQMTLTKHLNPTVWVLFFFRQAPFTTLYFTTPCVSSFLCCSILFFFLSPGSSCYSWWPRWLRPQCSHPAVCARCGDVVFLCEQKRHTSLWRPSSKFRFFTRRHETLCWD